jgi:hypothetical protein
MSDKDVEILKRSVDKILFYLHNDEGTGNKGLIAEVKQLSYDFNDFKRKYEDTELIKKTRTAVYGGIGAGIVLFIKYIGAFIIEHFKI